MTANVVVVGAGLGGMAAAITAADEGADVTLIEKGTHVGGAAAYSGGQVWVGGNHVAAGLGIEDSVEETLRYVEGAAAREAASLDPLLARQWLSSAPEAARYFEDAGVISWHLIPDYPDYYFPQLPGSRPAGRYLTGAPFNGHRLGEMRDRLLVSPHFPVGVTYGEMFGWGGMSSRTKWDWGLVRQRLEQDVLTFGTGIAAAFFSGVLERDVRVLLEHPVVELRMTDGRVTGVRCRSERQDVDVAGSIILATGAHDWSAELSRQFTGIPAADGGSLAPATLTGDAIDLVRPVRAGSSSIPPWAAPVLPGYRLSVMSGGHDTGYRACFEHCLPHTFLVNSAAERFADDSFHPSIVAAALRAPAAGAAANLPFFMIWDENHHAQYGLGATEPGGRYPDDLVCSAPTIAELARHLGLPPQALEETARRFNDHAVQGHDPDFGRGSNQSVRRFRGDWNNQPNPCLAPVERAPFFGMRMRLLNTGIAAAGVRTGTFGRALTADGATIDGLHAVGECADRAAAGVGYNSGYSLSRAMTYGYLAARDVTRYAG
jgi:3-oxosteroid 1-dehydrogenase